MEGEITSFFTKLTKKKETIDYHNNLKGKGGVW